MRKRRRPDHELMRANGLSKAEVFPSLELAWKDLARLFFAELPSKQRHSAKFCFYWGARAAANLMILDAGINQSIDKAADQISREVAEFDAATLQDIKPHLQ
jgi:hypothetical protein